MIKKIIAVVNTLWTNTFDTLYYECKNNPNYEFTFVIIPMCQPGLNTKTSINDISNMMNKKGYKYICGYNDDTDSYLDLKSLNPDIVLMQTPYDLQRISYLYSAEYIRSFSRVYTVSYGSTMIDYDKPPHINLLNNHLKNYDGCISESTELAKYLDKYNPGKYIPLGYVKCDKYLYYSNNPDFNFKSRDNYDFIIAWKPRWLVTLGWSNFLRYIRYFISFCKEHPNTELIFVKHSLIEDNMIQKGIATKHAVEEIFSELNSISNLKIVETEDFLDDVFNADIFVGDYCSTIMEFALTKKPVIYTNTEVSLSDYGKRVLKGMYIANSAEELDTLIHDLYNGKDELKEIRTETTKLISDIPANNMTIAQNILLYFDSLDYSAKISRPLIPKISEKNKKLNFKNKIEYKIWHHYNRILKEKGIV